MPMDKKLSINPPRGGTSFAFEVELERARKLQSAGTGPATWTTYQLGPTFEGLAEHLEEITAHVLVEDRSSANISYRIGLEKSYDGVVFSAGGFVLPAQNSNGYTITSAYTTRTDFGRYFRFVLELDDNGAVETALFSASMHLKLWS